MAGTKESLVENVGRGTDYLDERAMFDVDEISGSLVIYCGGCGLALGDDVKKVPPAFNAVTQTKPFIGFFTFGEQGEPVERSESKPYVVARKLDTNRDIDPTLLLFQGCFNNVGSSKTACAVNRHGNLMFSAGIFGPRRNVAQTNAFVVVRTKDKEASFPVKTVCRSYYAFCAAIEAAFPESSALVPVYTTSSGQDVELTSASKLGESRRSESANPTCKSTGYLQNHRSHAPVAALPPARVGQELP